MKNNLFVKEEGLKESIYMIGVQNQDGIHDWHELIDDLQFQALICTNL
jgi:hypothetical protein